MSDIRTPRTVVEAVEAPVTQATKAILIELLEKAGIADIPIVEEEGVVVAAANGINLIAWPAGVMIPTIGENLTPTLEVSECENCHRQSRLISQQHDMIKQETHLVRSLTRLIELYVGVTEVLAPCEASLTTAGGDDGPST